jgi:hypothetical protein
VPALLEAASFLTSYVTAGVELARGLRDRIEAQEIAHDWASATLLRADGAGARRQDGCARSALVYGIENVASAGSGGIAASHFA